MNQSTDIRDAVRRRYAAAAKDASSSTPASCCGGSPCGEIDLENKDAISRDIYSVDELGSLPSAAVLASLGCGNPTALAELRPGEVVLDLGSGGGIDVLLSARRVGPTGKAYGLDMTDEMLDLARRNQREANVENAEFLKGTIEAVPLPDASVDVVISNCVINLSTDKDRVLREAYRVLRADGRFAVSDIIYQGVMPEEIRRSIELWSGCIAGTLHEDEYRDKLAAAGFEAIDVEVTRVHTKADLGAAADDLLAGIDEEALARGHFCSAFIRAVKRR